MDGAADRGAMRELLGTSMWAELETPEEHPYLSLGAPDDGFALAQSIELTAQSRDDLWRRDEIRPFVPMRIDVDIERLRAELVGVAVLWLGVAAAGPVVSALSAAQPGVDEFVSAIASIEHTDVPGLEASFVRAMAREMHYRAAQALCGA